MTDFCSIGLTFDPTARRCDVAIGTNGLPVMDFTAATPMVISIGSDRRAQPDDALPYDAGGAGVPFNPRRGWVGDALDGQGMLIGSRLWLIHRAKKTEGTRQLAIAYANEATSWMESQYGVDVEVDAGWLSRIALGIVVQAGSTKITSPMPVT